MAEQETVMTTFTDDPVDLGLEGGKNKKDAASENLRAVMSKPAAKNRMIAAAAVVVAAVGVGAVMYSSGGSDSSGPVAVDKAPVQKMGKVGVNDTVSPEYAKLLEMQNAHESEQAAKNGGTHIDAIIPESKSNQKAVEPDLMESFPVPVEQPQEAPQSLKMPPASEPVATEPPPIQPSNAIDAQMKALQQSWGAVPHKVVSFNKGGNSGQQVAANQTNIGTTSGQSVGAQAAASQGNADEPAGPYTTVKVGKIIHSMTIIEANSDSNGSVVAEIIHGPYKGGKFLGAFKRVDEKMTLEFNTLSLPYLDKSIAITAIAVDTNVGSRDLSGEVDHHYFERWGLPFLASFISGVGSAVQNMGTTSTVVGTGSSTTTRPDLNTGDKAMIGVGAGANAIAQDLRAEARRPITVKIPSGTPIGVMFMANVSIPDEKPFFNE